MISLRSESCYNTQNDENQNSVPRRLAEIHHRQAVHQKKPRMLTNLEPPGGTGIHRQALQLKTQRNAHKWMSRLAAMYSPPGGFWKISRIQRNHDPVTAHA